MEVKATANAAGRQLSGLRALREDHPGVGRLVLVCLEPKRRRTPDGIEVLPVLEFLGRLWDDDLV